MSRAVLPDNLHRVAEHPEAPEARKLVNAMNINKHPIHKEIYDLCLEIEKLPASEQQTKIVIAASELHKSADKLTDVLPTDLLVGALDLTDDLRWILGRPCFMLHGIAEILRKSGYKCERKAEDEQAVAIHWMLLKYLEHGKNWRVEGDKELDQLRAALP